MRANHVTGLLVSCLDCHRNVRVEATAFKDDSCPTPPKGFIALPVAPGASM